MSRGLGALQRKVLAALGQDATADRSLPMTMRRLARELYGPAPTPAQRETLRQAVGALERRGLVETWWPRRGAMVPGRRVRLRPGSEN
jgi:hypothetical protein